MKLSLLRSINSVSSLLILVLSALSAHGGLVPPDRLANWVPGTGVGVPGGIPTATKIFRTITSTGDATDRKAEIQSAIDAAALVYAANPVKGNIQVVLLGPGNYWLSAGVGMTKDSIHNDSGVVLRGAGDSTILQPHFDTGGAFGVGTGSSFDWPRGDGGLTGGTDSGNAVRAGRTKGSTKITVGDTSTYVGDGYLMEFQFTEDETLPVVNTLGYKLLPARSDGYAVQGQRKQVVRTVSHTATTITFAPALADDFTNVDALVHVMQYHVEWAGFENFSVDCTNTATVAVSGMGNAFACWIKGVRILGPSNGPNNYPMSLGQCVNCEIRKCRLDGIRPPGGRSNCSGILFNDVTACLIEDNILIDCTPLFEINGGCIGNVFAYNYMSCPTYAVGWLDANHAPHNSFNLFEGNVCDVFTTDNYFGSVSHDTVYRNWFSGQNTSGAGPDQLHFTSAPLQLKRFTRKYSVVGNILGTPGWTMTYGSPADTSALGGLVGHGMRLGDPNIGNLSNNGGKAPAWPDYTREGLGTYSVVNGVVTTTQSMFSPADVGRVLFYVDTGAYGFISSYISPTQVGAGNPGKGGKYRVAPGPNGAQEVDADVVATTILKANYNYGDNAIPSGQALGSGETLDRSLFRSTAPTWFGLLAWPPFDPLHPAPTIDSIPAGYRYAHGTEPPTGAPAKTTGLEGRDSGNP